MSSQGIDLTEESSRIKADSFFKTLPEKIKNTFRKQKGEYDYSHEVHEAMMGCLECKSCVGQCPIKVNVPDFRARFLEVYYSRYLRPAKDYMIGSLEFMVPALSKFPAPYNWAMQNKVMKRVFKQYVGMVDSPAICKHTLVKGLQERGVEFASVEKINGMAAEQRAKSVIIVQDAFTSFFETQLVLDIIDLLNQLGFTVMVAPFMPNGKPLHVHGFMKAFEKAANKNAAMLRALDQTGVPLIGVDPSMTLTYRQEYTQAVDHLPTVNLLQEWLATQQEVIATKASALPARSYKLMAHCTEKTSAAASIKLWQQIYAALGQTLEVQAVGCCGMSGTYGHETENLATSTTIYDLSWRDVVNAPENQGKLVATGYSCRSQVKRMDEQQILHPAQALLDVIRANR
jgi:Fe-S oxidoreductase